MDWSALSVDLYVGEPKGQLNKRMNGYRSEINRAGNQILYQHLLEKIYITLLIVPNWVLLIVENAKNTGLDCWVLLPRIDAMTILIASGTSLAQEAILWMWCVYFQLPLDVDVVMGIDIIHHLIYIIFRSTFSLHYWKTIRRPSYLHEIVFLTTSKT